MTPQSHFAVGKFVKLDFQIICDVGGRARGGGGGGDAKLLRALPRVVQETSKRSNHDRKPRGNDADQIRRRHIESARRLPSHFFVTSTQINVAFFRLYFLPVCVLLPMKSTELNRLERGELMPLHVLRQF